MFLDGSRANQSARLQMRLDDRLHNICLLPPRSWKKIYQQLQEDRKRPACPTFFLSC
jgi:hypothetical protein